MLGTLNNRCRIIIGAQKGTIILTTTHVYVCRYRNCYRHSDTDVKIYRDVDIGIDIDTYRSICRYKKILMCRYTDIQIYGYLGIQYADIKIHRCVYTYLFFDLHVFTYLFCLLLNT